jgi:hypothetical protein
MSQFEPIPGTPKEILRGIRVFFVAIISGALVFAIVIVLVKRIPAATIQETREYTNTFLYIAAAIGAICLGVGLAGYNKAIAAAKDSLIPLKNKLNQYRAALTRYVALCEGAALFAIIAFFLTGSYYLLGIAAIMLLAMLTKAPTRQRVIDDLALDWNQQKELDQ